MEMFGAVGFLIWISITATTLAWSPLALFGQREKEVADLESREDFGDSERYKWTTVDWLNWHNYTYEIYNVTTADGYQLQLQRLPKPGAQPVLLVHGLFASSLVWVCKGPNRSLAFQLQHRNYDVWLANLRGSSPYGRRHTDLTDVMPEFWQYSFHEHGVYDLPAIIDRIESESVTVEQQIVLIGHSQAFNAFLVLCSLHPEYNRRIALMQALAPLARLRRYVKFDSKQMRRVMKFAKDRQKSNKYELFPPGDLRTICHESTTKKRDLCEYFVKHFAGSPNNNNKLLEPFNYEYLIQGGSYRELHHLQQIWKSGDFVAYDFGATRNLQVYRTVEPLIYNLSEVHVPLILYFGETDGMATPQGVHSIYSRMLNSVRSVRRISASKFNHLDFVVAPDVKTLVNDLLIELMDKFFSNQLSYIIE